MKALNKTQAKIIASAKYQTENDMNFGVYSPAEKFTGLISVSACRKRENAAGLKLIAQGLATEVFRAEGVCYNIQLTPEALATFAG